MHLVKAKCLVGAFHNDTTQQFYPGPCEVDADDEKLMALTTLGGLFVFQFPGHEGKSPAWEKEQRGFREKSNPAPVAVAVENPKPVNTDIAERRKANLAKARAARKAKTPQPEPAVA